MIQANRLLKYFGGRRALAGVSLEIDRGEALGVLGLNGVGKTTLLRILATDLRPTAGSLLVDGVDAVRNPLAIRRRIGFLPQVPPLYPEMAVDDYLRFAGRLHGLERRALERRLEEVADLIHIRDVLGELVRHLSHGYRQRVGLAQAILHDPALVILDEPTHGLDPAQVVEMRGLVRHLKERHTVLISSHNLPEISETCDRLLVLDAGRVIAMGSEAELSERLLGAMRIEVAIRAGDGDGAATGDGPGPAEAATSAVADVVACLQAVAGVSAVLPVAGRAGELAFQVEADGDRRAEVCRALVDAGRAVLRLDRGRHELEDVFLELVAAGAASSEPAPGSAQGAGGQEPRAAVAGRTP
jgi:ABC-2 type transport system ATP-binding protein